MSLADWLFGKAVRLAPQSRRRLAAWRALAEPDLHLAHQLHRYVVVDVESSGLSVYRDRLIAIGAVAVVDARVDLATSFHSVLRQRRVSSDDNILLHGITGTTQARGGDPAEALLAFLEFIGKAPLVAFRAPFDEIMIRKAMRRYLGEPFRRTWLDLAWLAPAIIPEMAAKTSLDDWTGAFGIANFRRHDALADAVATAQLFQVLQERATAQGMRSTRDLHEAARSQEWLARHRRITSGAGG